MLTTIPRGDVLDGKAEGLAPDAVDDQVEVAGDALDDFGSAETAKELLRCRALAHQCCDVGAALAGELDREPPDAAGCTRDQHALAEHQASDLECSQRRHTGGGQRGGLRVGYHVGDRRQSVGWNRGELRPGADVDQADDACALSSSAAVGCRTFDDTCRIPARDRSLAQIWQANDLAANEGECAHPHQCVIRQWGGVRDFGQRDERGGGARRQSKHGPILLAVRIGRRGMTRSTASPAARTWIKSFS